MTALRLALTLGAAAMLACGVPPMKPKPLHPLKPATPKAADPWAGRSDLITTPPTKPAAALTLPPLTRKALPNGLGLLVLPSKRLPLIAVQLLIPAGSIDDPPDKVGLADFTASMLRQGTKRMAADAISIAIDSAGASLGAGSGYETTSVSCAGRERTLDLCLQLVADLVLRPTFPEKEMKEIREQLAGAVKSSRDNPAELASQHFDNMLYGDDHPAGRPLTLESIKAITRADLRTFHRTRYLPAGAVLAISGAVTEAEVERRVRELFGRWRPGKRPPRQVPALSDPPKGLKVLLIDKPDLTQSFFHLGHAGIELSHPDRDAVRLMNYVLGGGGFSSRLMKVIRSQGGKTYGISSSFSSTTRDGSFSVSSFTRNAQTVEILRLTLQELRRLHDAPPTAGEITAAKGKLAGGYAIGFQTNSAIAAALADAQLRGLPDTYVTELPLRLDRQGQASVAAAAREHVRPDHLAVAIVGKAAEVAPLLDAAKIAYSKISYLDPVSARERARQANAAATPIDPAAAKAGQRLIERAVKTAGGAKRLAGIKSLRLVGKAKMGPMVGSYRMLVIPPDGLRVAIKAGKLDIAMVVDGQGGFAQMANGAKQPLPAEKLAELRRSIWRQPPLVLRNAIAPETRVHRVEPAGLPRGSQAVELLAAGHPPTTLVFDRRGRLLELRHRSARGQEQVSRYSQHRKVNGVLVPFAAAIEEGTGPAKSVIYDKIEINPELAADAIRGASPSKSQ